MSEQWIEANIGTAVDRTISNEILIKKSKVYSRQFFFSPLYYPCAAQHAAARSSGAAETEHRDHDVIHYNDGEIKMTVNKRKASLRKRHGNLASLGAES